MCVCVLSMQITSGFELYAVFSPLASKQVAIAGVNRLLRWIKKEEERLFIINSLTIWHSHSTGSRYYCYCYVNELCLWVRVIPWLLRVIPSLQSTAQSYNVCAVVGFPSLCLPTRRLVLRDTALLQDNTLLSLYMLQPYNYYIQKITIICVQKICRLKFCTLRWRHLAVQRHACITINHRLYEASNFLKLCSA